MNQLLKELQVTSLHKEYDRLQQQYGEKDLNSIYGAGCITHPKVMFVFMNPTGRNVASSKDWKGIKAAWLGTKNIWKLFYKINVLDSVMYEKICSMKGNDWDAAFAQTLYQSIADKKIYITNLGKCTQIDARPLPNKVFKEYLSLLEREIDFIKPNIIITFGNQVSSILLNQPISVSTCRKAYYTKEINEKEYKIYPTFYPVGQGMRNIELAIQDIIELMKENELL